MSEYKTTTAEERLKKLPPHVREKLEKWDKRKLEANKPASQSVS